MPLDSPVYDPLEDITLIFSTRESLDELDSLLAQTRAYKAQLQAKIDQNIASIRSVETNENPVFKLEALDKVFSDYNDAQVTASKINSTITNLTKNISHLDCAKHNLSHSLTVFQNLKILVDSYVQCKQLARTNSYLEMVSPYKIMCSLAETSFVSYRSVGEINRLLNSVKRLKSQILDSIKQTYTELLSGKLSGVVVPNNLETELKEGACELLESTPSVKSQTIDWCTDRVLYEMCEIFRPDDEAGSLENLSRRYLYFKKLLNNFNSNLAPYFPASWEMPLKITAQFCNSTKNDLDILLRTEFQNKSPSIDLFMSSLQLTLDLEKYIDVRFANKYKGNRLSVCFEPYLSLWISHQDAAMEKKLLAYMAEPKLKEDSTEPQVVPSSADLFRTYRSLLSQTLELLGDSNQNGTILTSLASFFSRWLNDYGNRVLKPLLLPDNIEIENKVEVIQYTVLLINTCDYCSITTSQLEEKLAQLTSNPQNISTAFTTTKDLYDDLLARGNRLLLKRVIPLDLVFAWKEFDNFDWSRVMVEDYSRYMVTLKNCLLPSSSNSTKLPTSQQSPTLGQKRTLVKQSSLEIILSLLSREVYKYNFLDKVIDLTTSEYIDCITRLLQPIPPFATLNNQRILDTKHVIHIGEQLSLDLQLLKDVFYGCLEGMASDSRVSTNTSYRRLEKHIDANITLLSNFVKLLAAPLDSPGDYQETYMRLTDDNQDVGVWAFILTLKGIPWDLSVWKLFWEEFKKYHDNTNDEEVEIDRKRFVFKWDTKYLMRFETNLGRVRQQGWASFIKDELKISSTRRGVGNPIK